MAHILVYAQRTPHGIHPASAAALCLARDLGSEFGATITAVCPGDAGKANYKIARATGRFGADILLFAGPSGLATLQKRLNPGLVLVPWTDEGISVARTLPEGPATPHLLHEPQPEWTSEALVSGIIAGTLPWYDLATVLDADIEIDAADVALPAWALDVDSPTSGPLLYVGPGDIDPMTRSNLATLGASPVEPGEVGKLKAGTVLWLATDPAAPPPEVASRGPAVRLVLFPGVSPRFHPNWSCADWVLPGLWPEATKQLHSEMWKLTLA
ncbi:MAG: hypothetical protein KC420_21540 [Myxococcales bacterium]|nr:hypothetical protein [Myxococcales bacterium]MCB9701687.1 hypothetical protein [Myxococcales bacterium]